MTRRLTTNEKRALCDRIDMVRYSLAAIGVAVFLVAVSTTGWTTAPDTWIRVVSGVVFVGLIACEVAKFRVYR